MFLALMLSALWIVLALRHTAPVPTWALVATGVPLLGLITVYGGPGPGLLCLALGAWVLRGRLFAPWQEQDSESPLRD